MHISQVSAAAAASVTSIHLVTTTINGVLAEVISNISHLQETVSVFTSIKIFGCKLNFLFDIRVY